MDEVPQADPGDVTRQLLAFRDGDAEALDRLMPMVYGELRRVAQRQLGRIRPGQTLDPTALVHESYFKLVRSSEVDWQSRAHFLGVAARAMRQVIVAHARQKGAAKRGGGDVAVTLDEARIAVGDRADELVAIDDALVRLSKRNARLARVVECRFFGGLSEEETAAALDISLRTAQRDWMRARAWLREDLLREDPPRKDLGASSAEA